MYQFKIIIYFFFFFFSVLFFPLSVWKSLETTGKYMELVQAITSPCQKVHTEATSHLYFLLFFFLFFSSALILCPLFTILYQSTSTWKFNLITWQRWIIEAHSTVTTCLKWRFKKGGRNRSSWLWKELRNCKMWWKQTMGLLCRRHTQAKPQARPYIHQNTKNASVSTSIRNNRKCQQILPC